MKTSDEISKDNIKDGNLREAVRVFQNAQDVPNSNYQMKLIAYGLENLCTFLAKKEGFK